MREIILQLLTLLIPFCLIGSVTGFECYKTDGISMKLRSQYCNPVSQPYCLKAMVYDGRVIRDCASAQQCPQGDGCAPITYDEDGTTDFVCCCMSACATPVLHYGHLLQALL
uniref:Uncharacterized protein n=1 Tax=Ditylenchus dipsaci TaxID=166011 RepID=A0A915E5A7_9BILA